MSQPTVVAASLELAPVDWSKADSLVWTQRGTVHRTWELRADGEPVAEIRWFSPWRRRWLALSASGAWEIRESFWSRQSIGRTGEEPVVTTRRGLRSVEVQRTGGEPLVWRRENWLGTTLVLENRERFPLLRIQRRRGFLRIHGAVALEDAGRSLEDLEPLIFVTWTLTLAAARPHAH